MATGVMKTDTSGLSSQYQTLFNKQLLDHAKELVVTSQFFQQKSVGKNLGATTIEFFRPQIGDRTRVATLTEGVPLAEFQQIQYETVNATLVQYGEAARYSDIVSNTALFNMLDNASRQLGEDAAYHLDFLCVTEAVTGVASGNERYTGGASDFATFDALSNANGKLTIKDLLGSYTKLTKTRAPMINGMYAAVLAPEQTYDIMDDDKFVDAGVRGNNPGLYNGEIGTWYGHRIFKTTQPWIEDSTKGTYNSAGDNFSALIIGRDALGAPFLSGMGQKNPSMIVVNTPDSGNVLNQFISVGWKSYWTTITLKDDWFVVLRSKSTFVA